MIRDYTGPIILIALGIFLLANQFDLLSFRWLDIITYGFVLIGFLMTINAFDNAEKRGLLGGVFFISYGTALILMRHHVVYPSDNFGFGTFFLALALGNLAYFLFNNQRILNLTWTIIFAAVGVVFLYMYYGALSPWYVREQIATYWPVALIVLGLGIIVNAYRKRNSVSHS
jgi:hypothetical protein